MWQLIQAVCLLTKAAVQGMEEHEKRITKRNESIWVCAQCGTKTEGYGYVVCCKKCGCNVLQSVATLNRNEAHRQAAEKKEAESARRQRERRSSAKARWSELRGILTCLKCKKTYDKTFVYCPGCAGKTTSLPATSILDSMKAEFPDLVRTVDDLDFL